MPWRLDLLGEASEREGGSVSSGVDVGKSRAAPSPRRWLPSLVFGDLYARAHSFRVLNCKLFQRQTIFALIAFRKQRIRTPTSKLSSLGSCEPFLPAAPCPPPVPSLTSLHISIPCPPHRPNSATTNPAYPRLPLLLKAFASANSLSFCLRSFSYSFLFSSSLSPFAFRTSHACDGRESLNKTYMSSPEADKRFISSTIRST